MLRAGHNGATDVFVVGGGPAGLAAAIAARLQGFRVTLAERSRPPVDKACGEGLMPEGVAALDEFGIDTSRLEAAPFGGIRFLGDAGSVQADFPRGRALGIRRTTLHQALHRRAEELGVRLLWGAAVSAMRSDAVLVDNHAVTCRFIVGADGHNSRVARWAGLNAGREYERRIGLRRHFAVAPWSDHVEIYWGEHCQAYITPVAAKEVCVALLSQRPLSSYAEGVASFPALAVRLGTAPPATEVRGAFTLTRQLKAVARGNVALIGDASGSADAIAGEGLAMSFRQALALARAMMADELVTYDVEHRRIGGRPQFMARSLLLMDHSRWVREHALRAFAAKPGLFQRLLAVHVGELPLRKFGVQGVFGLGWRMLTA